MSAGRLGNVELTGEVSVEAITRAHERARGEALRNVAVGTLTRSPWQPRGKIERNEDFLALADSIKTRGVLEPLLAREVEGGRLELLAGERRLEAARAAGLSTVPVRVFLGLDDLAAREIALVENLARQNLTPWEEAQGLDALAHVLEASERAASVRALASLAGRSNTAVHRSRQIAANCTPEVQKLAKQRAGAGGVPSWNTLPGNVLEAIAKGTTPDERAKLLLLYGAPYVEHPGATPTASARTRKPRRKLRAPITVKGNGTVGPWSVSATMPPAKLPKADARKALDALEPIVKALRARLK